MTVSVDVTNTGTRAGDEVVQLYAQHVGSKVERPREDLRGYKRVTLAPGQTRTVEFSVPASSLAYWNPRHARVGGRGEPSEVASRRVVGGHTTREDDQCRGAVAHDSQPSETQDSIAH